MQKTIQNLTKAFIGESQARNRYTIYSKIAKNEGFEQISEIFLKTADQEREHAKWLFRMINELKENNEDIIVEAGAPTMMGTTAENLQAAVDGETYEYSEMYPEFAKIAEEEGLTEVAERLKSIAIAEKHHEEVYTRLLSDVKEGKVFKKEASVTWVCKKCGYTHEGTEAPDECPSCGHEQAYFEVRVD